MSEKKKVTQWQPGESGNPAGRPLGSKNKITLLRQSLELQLREQAEPSMPGVMEKAVELALEGDKSMIKMLLEMHMARGDASDARVVEKVAIQINTVETPEIVTITEEDKDERQTDE